MIPYGDANMGDPNGDWRESGDDQWPVPGL